MAPAPRLGGVSAQLLARIEARARDAAVALLHADGADGAWRLEAFGPTGRWARRWTIEPASNPERLERPDLEELVASCLDLCGAQAIHVETPSDLPLESLHRLAQRYPTVLSLHDFALFCPRPHLLERPIQSFCHFCRDMERCHRCLASTWLVDHDLQVQRRRASGRLLRRVRGLVFPSAYLLERHRELFDLGRGASSPSQGVLVLPPALPALPDGPPPPARTPHWPPRRVGFVGGGHVHKGASVLSDLVRDLSRSGSPQPRWFVYGGGGHDRLAELRRLPGVTVRGYYRGGTLPRRLVEDRIDLVLLLSIVPESYSLVLDECRLAAAPVVAFDHGAVADRLPPEAGALVPLENGSAGVAALLGATRPPWGDGISPVETLAALASSADRIAHAMTEFHASLD